jgi:hypothetical protein
LSDSKERGSEYDISDGPAVFKGSGRGDKLRDDINHSADQRPQNVDDEKGDGLHTAESDVLFESGNKESGVEHHQATNPQELGR